jgi:hypothetical protein
MENMEPHFLSEISDERLEQMAEEYRASRTPAAIREKAKEFVFMLMFGYEQSTGQNLQLLLSGTRIEGEKIPIFRQSPSTWFALNGVKPKFIPDYKSPDYWETLAWLYCSLEFSCDLSARAEDSGDITEAWAYAAECRELEGRAKIFAAMCGDGDAAQALSRLGTDARHAKNRARKQDAFAWLTKNPPKPRGKANAARHISKQFYITEETGKEWVKEWEKKKGFASRTPVLPIAPTGTAPK